MAGFHDFVIGIAVAIGDPALAVCTNAGELRVVASAPDGVGIEQPEGRRPCSRGQVDVEVGLQSAQVADQMNRRIEVGTESAALTTWSALPVPSNLKLVHAVLCDHVRHRIAKDLVVAWAGQRHAAIDNLVAIALGRSHARLLGGP